jgi:integrase
MSLEERTTRKGEERYEVRIRDRSGREYSRTFRTKREAEAFEEGQRADRARGAWLDPRTGEMAFGTWADEWLVSDPAKSPSALARDETILRVHLLPTLCNRPLASITPSDIQALVTTWAQHAKPRTVRRQYDTLRAILNAAVKEDLIGRSPCRHVKLPAFETTPRPVLDAAGLARLADAIGVEFKAMVYVGAVLGLRWGEVAGLHVRSVDVLGRTVTVDEQRTRGLRGRMITRQPKSEAGLRTLSSPPWLMEMLAEHLRRRGVTAAEPGELVFVTADGEGLDYSHWRQRVWLPGTERAGFAGLQFHDLRRTAATALVTERIDIKTAQVRLGHADPATTLGIYAQATKQADRDAAERLGVHFHPPVATSVRLASVRPARGIDAG